MPIKPEELEEERRGLQFVKLFPLKSFAAKAAVWGRKDEGLGGVDRGDGMDWDVAGTFKAL